MSLILRGQRQNIDRFELVPLADLIVVEVVGRGDLHATGAELAIDVAVGDDRYRAAGQRQLDVLADQMLVAPVVGIDRDGDVAEQGFRPRGGDDQRAAAVRQRVFDFPDFAVFLFAVDFKVGHRGAEHRDPS